MRSIVIIRGGGDLATGVAFRLHRAGIATLILEAEKPLAVRRQVAFAEAVFSGSIQVEGVAAKLVADWNAAQQSVKEGNIPVMIDPQASILKDLRPLVIVDARMLKQDLPSMMDQTSLLIGIGPGFEAGKNCHAVIESQRGHHLGRVFWSGRAAENTGIPGSINKYKKDRVLYAPSDGTLNPKAKIGDLIKQGELIASVNSQTIIAPFDGLLRGLIHRSVPLTKGMKIGDLDPRNDPSYTAQISDKALAIGGGVLEALLSQSDFRKQLWNDRI